MFVGPRSGSVLGHFTFYKRNVLGNIGVRIRVNRKKFYNEWILITYTLRLTFEMRSIGSDVGTRPSVTVMC